jgi:hypothetical protein
MTKPQGMERLAELIAYPEHSIVLCGEIWVAPEVLAAAGLNQWPKGLVELALSIRADICFFHWSENLMPHALREMVKLSHGLGIGCGLTKDGPFQRLTQTADLLTILEELGRSPASLQFRIAEEAEKIVKDLALAKETGIDLIILCDDLAYTGGLYFSPSVFRDLILPHYSMLACQVTKNKFGLGWHSDGDVSPILPELIDCGFRFFSLESECVDLFDFKRSYTDQVTLIGGIRTTWLTQKKLSRESQEECLKEIRALADEGGLILSSSCGLYNPEFVPTLKEIYQLVGNI